MANWFAAQLRAARYRAGYALRLAGFAVLGLGVLLLGGLGAIGRLDDIGSALADGLDARLARSGFAVASVDVAGARHVPVEMIARAVGVAPQASLLSLDPQAARARIEALSWVQTARVSRLWPDRVTVIVSERVPYALWQAGGYHQVIDQTGYVISDADPLDYDALPRVVGDGANLAASGILPLLALQPTVRERITHAVRVGDRRWNLRLAAGGDILLPETDPASALALIATLQEERGVLDLEAEVFDLRTNGELVIRAWPDRAQAARGRGA